MARASTRLFPNNLISDLTVLKMNKELTVKRWQPKSFITDRDKHKIVVVMDCAYIVNKTGKSYEGTQATLHMRDR